jgi:DNA-binding winged helix-turn-helix (wHTH) protein/tetratricopeptide (TPR) repeat protein
MGQDLWQAGQLSEMRYEFQPHCLDVQRRELIREGNPVAIARKPLAVLLHLLEHRERMISKAELLETFWPSVVSESVLQSTIRQIRMAVGDDGRSQRVIRTYHGQGFRFVAPVSIVEASPAGTIHGGHRSAGSMADTAARPRSAEVAHPPAPGPITVGFEEHRLSAVLACRLACAGGNGGQALDGPVGAFLSQATRLAELHGGLMLHVMPDGFTAVFGAALGVEKGTYRAYDCARDLTLTAAARRLDQAAASPRFGIAAGHFPVVAERGEARVRALNFPVLKSALALADAATPGHAAISGRAASHLSPKVRRRQTACGELPLKRAPPALTEGSNLADPGFDRFVGRRAQMAFLGDTLERTLRGCGEMAVLAGEAGIGKSRLVAEFLAHAERRGCLCLKLLSDPRERNTPLAVMAALARRIGLALGASDTEHEADDTVDRALWHDLLGKDTGSDALMALTPHMRRQRTFRVIRARLACLAARGPMVLVIEDIHWLDATSRDCLDYLGQTIEGLAVLLIVTTRPAPETLLAAVPAVTTLRLPPLEPPDGLLLLQSRLSAGGLAPDDADALVERACGNPFFLEQLLVAVEGGADPHSGLPDTVQEVIAVRIGRLSAEARALLLAAAVVGPRARADVIIGTVGWDDTAFEAVVCELLASGVLIEDPPEPARSFRFRHILLQNVAYSMLLPEDRRDLHRRVARVLSGLADAGAPPERLAWHHQEAGDTLAAVTQWTRAARAALQRSASREGVAFARNGLRLLDRDARDLPSIGRELELQLTLAPGLAATLGYGSDEVGVAYRRARDLSRSAGTPRSEFRMLVGLWNYSWVRGDLAQAHRHAEDLLGLAERTGDATLRLRAHACMGEILFHMGAFPAAARHLDAACKLFADSAEVRAVTRVPAVACHCYAAWTASFLGRPAAALGFCDRAGDIADELLHPFSMSLYLALKAELLLFEGDVPGCLDTARAACAISLREGFPFWHGTALVNLGWAEAHAGDPDRGLASLREGIAIFEATGARVQLANWYGLLAEALHLAGDLAAARMAADTAADWARRTGDVFFLPRIARTRAALGRGS